ncbi:MAG: maleylpyruvate isomerase family mycothiol-dependent enzyme [SAR202 cluster bacterium]|jgi:uncharacterized protein (TIGR03083 family)|nr:maleylpyruvate isomerase family mycothiol-dependent enzyme [SAR202 cluster bacterium]HAL48231.1 hypothetical protein [Dehalococcoidia bacterium]MDP6665658.1 maleylpyruvate isomerase family mycothiol-dependent enzyme [SAR202 cluster bacterium]MDP6799936.1 maleylpyruvate isomerase family mycothiol-dependent enzyme [SAR202 cluster bacterium]MQG57138.1 maleylpyruvate isomerase family mycothiol-dependent enzyme [SAR202 cluster bacterium]|tara:strand:+ start:2931 stop:3743 length:813 start_codon:yes stop_codon:yes gene_type:complete
MQNDQIPSYLDIVWSSMSALCAGFGDDEWRLPTDCPGWSVQDQLSHIVGSESTALGNPAPDHTPPESSHIKNAAGASNEIQVDWRRSWPGSRVLAEFNDVTAKRREALAAMTEADFNVETETARGTTTMADRLGIRIFDAWVHEQDMRRAVDVPGHFDGPVAEYAMERMIEVMPFVVGRRAGAPDGASVVFRISAPFALDFTITVFDGRASRVPDEPEHPTVTLSMSSVNFLRLCAGRVDPDVALNAGLVRMSGFFGLGDAIVRQMSYIP